MSWNNDPEVTLMITQAFMITTKNPEWQLKILRSFTALCIKR